MKKSGGSLSSISSAEGGNDSNDSENEEIAAQQSDKNELALLLNFSDDQQLRYEHYRRSKLPYRKVKKVISETLGTRAPNEKTVAMDRLAIGLAGVSKMFAGQLIEAAREIKLQNIAEESKMTPLTPSDIKAAYAKLLKERPDEVNPSARKKPKLI